MQTYSPVRFNFVVTAYYVLVAGYVVAVAIFFVEVAASNLSVQSIGKEDNEKKPIDDKEEIILYGGKRFVRME